MIKRIAAYAFVVFAAMLGSLPAFAADQAEMVAYSAARGAGSYGAQSATHDAILASWASSGEEESPVSASMTRIGNHFVMKTAKPMTEGEPVLG